jgi:hypothetical protein
MAPPVVEAGQALGQAVAHQPVEVGGELAGLGLQLLQVDAADGLGGLRNLSRDRRVWMRIRAGV